MPDIDIDFDDARRNEVLKYVADKYGHDHVAQVITFGTMAARGSIRDAGRALGYSYDFCDKIAKMIPDTPNKGKSNLKNCIENVAELKVWLVLTKQLVCHFAPREMSHAMPLPFFRSRHHRK